MANELDVELQWESRKILLVLDNCAAHPRLDSLRNIQVEFLSCNMSLVQPMNMGIVKKLSKTLYCAKLVNYILEVIQESVLTLSSTAKEVSASIDLSHGAQFIADSWQRLSTETIQNCFADCGFKQSNLEMSNKVDVENDILLEMHHVGNYKEFSYSAVVFSVIMKVKTGEASVQQIAAKCHKTSEDQATEEHEQVINQDTVKFIAGL
jgi:hypothetical protein